MMEPLQIYTLVQNNISRVNNYFEFVGVKSLDGVNETNHCLIKS